MEKDIDIKELWIQEEARLGRILVYKVPGGDNPADLMTKTLSKKEIDDRLRMMSIRVRYNQIAASVDISQVVDALGGCGAGRGRRKAKRILSECRRAIGQAPPRAGGWKSMVPGEKFDSGITEEVAIKNLSKQVAWLRRLLGESGYPLVR